MTWIIGAIIGGLIGYAITTNWLGVVIGGILGAYIANERN
ncbi:MAG: glycine zipper 2TM domain-containing protein [Candidatus Nanoarchaeia archaeon]|nr:glycine zipper 2TM domain-containing protein [Candidatus Nanoarchaeia archaeon]